LPHSGAYDEAINPCSQPSTCSSTLSDQPYLVGSRITEADWRLFTTLVRFGFGSYVGQFQCELRRIVDYPNLWRYVRYAL